MENSIEWIDWVLENKYTIEITQRGKSGIWYNTKIGRTFSATASTHPEDNMILGFMCSGCFFVPLSHCNILERLTIPETPITGEYGSNNSVKIIATQLASNTQSVFESMREASRQLNIPVSTIFKYSLTGKQVYGYTFKRS